MVVVRKEEEEAGSETPKNKCVCMLKIALYALFCLFTMIKYLAEGRRRR